MPLLGTSLRSARRRALTRQEGQKKRMPDGIHLFWYSVLDDLRTLACDVQTAHSRKDRSTMDGLSPESWLPNRSAQMLLHIVAIQFATQLNRPVAVLTDDSRRE